MYWHNRMEVPPMTNHNELVRKMTMTVSVPLELYVWLKRTQRNVSAYVVEAVENHKQSQTDSRRGQQRLTQSNTGVNKCL